MTNEEANRAIQEFLNTDKPLEYFQRNNIISLLEEFYLGIIQGLMSDTPSSNDVKFLLIAFIDALREILDNKDKDKIIKLKRT